MIFLLGIYSNSLFPVLRKKTLILTALVRYLTVDYLLAELIQRSYCADREQVLRRAQEEYDKYLEALDSYGLLSAGDKKLYDRYTNDPSSFHLASMTDAAARRHTKVARFKEEKELKQKLEVWFNFPSFLYDLILM
jgi:immunoglobulin-binding protein 1